MPDTIDAERGRNVLTAGLGIATLTYTHGQPAKRRAKKR